MEESSMMTWMSSNVNIVADTATRAKYIIVLRSGIKDAKWIVIIQLICGTVV
jgi:hypothetical protein